MADRPFGEVGESLSFVLSLMQKKCGEISPHFFLSILNGFWVTNL